MSAKREDIAVKLLAVIAGAYQWGSPPSRRLKLWSDVPAAQRPAAFLQEPGETRIAQSLTLTKRAFKFRLFVYTNAKPVNAETPGASEINAILDAIDKAFEPSGADKLTGRMTLGGIAVQHCQINGEILIDAGDLDGDGLAVVPIQVLMP
jgi:hypothetical protein